MPDPPAIPPESELDRNAADPPHRLTLFLICTAVLSGLLYGLMAVNEVFRAMAFLPMMWAPGISALLAQRLTGGRLRDLGFTWGQSRWQALAFALPVTVPLVVYPLLWLRLRSGSLWTAAILHGAHNIYAQEIFEPLTADTGFAAYITGEFGCALPLAHVLIAVLFFWRRRDRLHGPAKSPRR